MQQIQMGQKGVVLQVVLSRNNYVELKLLSQSISDVHVKIK